ncbi:MAG: hypothetical protein AAFQ80_19655 [Cyanobacteria bacterium J06621_8]
MFIPNLLLSLISGIWHIGVAIVSFPINLAAGILKFLFTPIVAIFLFLSPGNAETYSSSVAEAVQKQNTISNNNSVQEYVMDIEDSVRYALNNDAYIEKKGSKIIASLNDERRISPDIYADNRPLA